MQVVGLLARSEQGKFCKSPLQAQVNLKRAILMTGRLLQKSLVT